MTEGDAAPDRRQRARLLAGRISCIVGLLFGAVQVSFALLDGGANISAGVLGIAFCILGYYLDSRRLATVTVFLCVAAIFFGLPASFSTSASQRYQHVSFSPSASPCSARGTAVCSVRGDAQRCRPKTTR